MSIDGLALLHVKSHLQKYRLNLSRGIDGDAGGSGGGGGGGQGGNTASSDDEDGEEDDGGGGGGGSGGGGGLHGLPALPTSFFPAASGSFSIRNALELSAQLSSRSLISPS